MATSTTKIISQQFSDKAQVTFHDVAANFTEEEWRLLHEWQREVYKNVMNEIHQALLSLGPVIATSVFSLRGQEKEDIYHVELDSDRIHGGYCSPHDKMDRFDVGIEVNQEECQYVKACKKTDERITNDSFSTAFPVLDFDNALKLEHELASSLTAHQDAEVTESNVSSGQETKITITTFRIKEEDEIYSMDHLDSDRRGLTCSSKRPPAESWTQRIKCFEKHLEAIDETKYDPARKQAMMYNCLGVEGRRLFDHIASVEKEEEEDQEWDVFTEAKARMKNYFDTTMSVIMERFNFYYYYQAPGQSVESYVATLMMLATTCSFRDMDEMIRDQVVMRTTCIKAQEKLLCHGNPSLEKVVSTSKSMERSAKGIKLLRKPDNHSAEVNLIRK
ncbi:hypothetical protein NDU88_005136 [Pleurodeles waltl]|uniref:KRAB domain-containing protein n=1 Tax=Pleurodeles waltl TaxID=8319 RepID=A0AAV7RHN1_PLEWA|nr:hypothetical protein NDU88_005136 [Pleurodeles waltl]